MSEQLLALVSQYGAPALFAMAAIGAIGAPLPITLLLIVAGSMVSQGAMNLWWAIGLASAGAVVGDMAGYAAGRWGGQALVERAGRMLGKSASLKAMETKAREWGGPGIFLTRWVLTPLGPWINLACGTAQYPWGRFLFWDILGEVVGAAVCIMLGRTFSDRVMAMDAVLGDVSWAVGALIAAIVLGWQLVAYLRRAQRGRA